MRTKEAFEYKEEHEDMVLNYVSKVPASTTNITSKIKEHLFAKIHRKTVERLLENLKERGKIKKIKIGRTNLWQLWNQSACKKQKLVSFPEAAIYLLWKSGN
jgi:predicted transcriptional regulator